ncbi:MAG TPA: ankyrin repeat domain-containing protein [Jatrophihabitantaceae bacterium]
MAIKSGDLEALREVLVADPGVATSRLGGPAGGRTPLHVVTDWPGFFPNGPQIAQLLIDAGADVNARGGDGTGETPLHWAASSDDADVAEVLIDAGADVNAPDGSIGTVLDNAVGYGCWNVARLLVGRGATVDKLWLAAGLGLSQRLRELLAQPGNSAQGLINQAFWHACAGGQRRAAELLVQRGADLAFTPDYGHGTVVDVARNYGTQQSNLIEWLEQIRVDRTSVSEG